MRLPLSLAACAALAGCAHTLGPPPIELTVSGDEHGCRFEAERRLLAAESLSGSEAMLRKAARRWKGRSVTILGGTDAPYKCFGLAVHVLQTELVNGRIGFIAEPPPGVD